jgi:3-dehydroquinate dehydratase
MAGTGGERTMKFAWDKIDEYIIYDYDLLIVSASYEERCLSLAQHISSKRLSHTIIFFLNEYKEHVTPNLQQLVEIMKEKEISCEIQELFHRDSIKTIDIIDNIVNRYVKEKNIQSILIDSSTFTHEVLLMMFMLLEYKYPHLEVSFAYSNASDYDCPNSTSKSVERKWLSKGIDGIRSVLGYPGNLLPTKQTHLMIIVGYEYDRAMSVITEMEPSSLSLGFGKSNSLTTSANAETGKHYGAKEHFNEIVRDAISVVPKNKVFEFDISCNNPEEARKDIQMHLEKHSEHISGKNIVLFAMNNKLSTMGAALFALKKQDIQICYAPALLYNYENYSTPGNDCYIFKWDIQQDIIE